MKASRCILIISLLPLLGSVGCIAIPVGKETVAGPNYSDEALAFLNLPGTTREEAISTFGPPSLELHDLRVLAYECQPGTKWFWTILIPEPVLPETTAVIGPSVEKDAKRILLIAYGEDGIISAHKVARLGSSSLQEHCEKWARSLRQSFGGS